MTEMSVNIAGTVNSAIMSVTQGMAGIVSGLITGEMGIDQVGRSILSLIGNVLVELGQATIAAGVAALAIESLFASPLGAIAAGVAAVAVGSAISAASASVKNIGGSRGGARSGGASDNSNFRGSSTGNFSGGTSGGGTVVFEIAGTKLIGVMNNSLSRNRALGGSLGLIG